MAFGIKAFQEQILGFSFDQEALKIIQMIARIARIT